MTQDEIIEMARQAGMRLDKHNGGFVDASELKRFAKLVAAKAIAKDREEFDIDELCARQNKIGYKQGYRAGQLAEREACALICIDEVWASTVQGTAVEAFNYASRECANRIRARGEA